jgi:4-hydroxy-3-polyprenylbenzoate decarboxylase
MKRVTLAWTGASGLGYGLRLLECLLAAGCRVDLLVSQAARIVARQELDLALPGDNRELAAFLGARVPGHPGSLHCYGREEWFSPAASGSNPADAMVVCPCTMGSLAAIAHGLADNLIERAADVMLKERRPLILVPRETPFSLIHLRNMTQLAEAGATLLPANPGFYHHPENVGQVVDFVVARILDQLGVAQTLMPRWGANEVGDGLDR